MLFLLLGGRYFPRSDAATERLIDPRLTPLRIKRFCLQRAARTDAGWLRDSLNSHSAIDGCRFVLGDEDRLYLH
jgi:hypothetical protein